MALGIAAVAFLSIPSEGSFLQDITTSEATGASPHAHEYVFLLAKMMDNLDKRNASRAIAFSAFRPLDKKEGISAVPFSQEI